MDDVLAVIVVFLVVVLVVGSFIRISIKLRRGGGSLTTINLGATDGFLTQEKSKAAEVIVNENAGKKFDHLPSTGPKEPPGSWKLP